MKGKSFLRRIAAITLTAAMFANGLCITANAEESQAALDLAPLFENHLEYYIPFDGDSRDMMVTTTTPNQVAYEDGMFGQAARFNTNQGRVRLSRTEFPGDYSFSISMWVKDRHPSGDPVLFSNKNWVSGANVGFVFSTRAGNVRFNCNASGTTRVDYDTNRTINDDQWHLFTATIDRQGGMMRMYIDGQPAGSGSIAAYAGLSLTPSQGYNATVGNDGTGQYPDARNDCLIDEFMMFNRVVTPEEVTTLYETGSYYIDQYNARVFNSNSDVSVFLGGSAVLPIKEAFVGSSSVTYEIADPAVISLNTVTGSVTGLRQGQTTVTAKRSGYLDDIATVTVLNYEWVRFALDKSFTEGGLVVGDTGTVKMLENNVSTEVEWSSTNPSVLSIDQNGSYAALAVGTADIIARSYMDDGGLAEDSVRVTVGNKIPFNFRAVGAEWATVDTPFLVNIHFDTDNVSQAIESVEAVFSYDPAVLEYTAYRSSGATYTNDPTTGELKAVFTLGSRTNSNPNELITASRIGQLCFKLKSDAPTNTTTTVLGIKEVIPQGAGGIGSRMFDITKRELTIKTHFDPDNDLNGDGLVSIGDVAISGNPAAVATDGKLGFYPVKRVIYVGIDGGGNYLVPEGYRETSNTLNLIFTYGAKNNDPVYHFDMFDGPGGLAETGSYTWNAQSANPPISGQTWTAMMYGYEPSDSSTYTITNDIAGSRYYPTEASPFKSIYEQIRVAQPNRRQTTMIEWGSMENGIVGNNTGAYQYRGGSMALIDEAIRMIDSGEMLNTSFAWVAPDQYMDGIGHGSARWYTPAFYEAGRLLANKIDELVKAIDENDDIKDDTAFMIGSDHGGYNTGHGQWRASEYYVMMYTRGPVFKSGFKYDGDNGTLGNRGDEDARQKDWAALYARAMGVEACPAWIGNTDNHPIFLTQAEVSQKGRSVEQIGSVKKDNGYYVDLSRIQTGNEDKITAAHFIFSGEVNASAITVLQDSEILSVFQKDGKTNVIVKSDNGAYEEGTIMLVRTADDVTLENIMLGKTNGREIYPDLNYRTEAGVLNTNVALSEKPDGLINGNFTVVNTGATTLSAQLILAVYNNGRLTDTTINNISVSADSMGIVNYSIQASAGSTVKGFIWRENDYVPLCAEGVLIVD